VHAAALEADGQTLAAAQQRVLLRHCSAARPPAPTTKPSGPWSPRCRPINCSSRQQRNPGGWTSLALAVKRAGTLEQQQAAIDTWRARTRPPGRQATAGALTKLKELASQPLTKIALLLPQEGRWPVARALREGFMAAHFQAQQAGQPPAIELFDSSRMTSLDEFYRQAQAAGVQLVVGPLEKPLVKQLAPARNCRSPPWR
jgi:outer membrane PBP1 activator LpoA protein